MRYRLGYFVFLCPSNMFQKKLIKRNVYSKALFISGSLRSKNLFRSYIALQNMILTSWNLCEDDDYKQRRIFYHPCSYFPRLCHLRLFLAGLSAIVARHDLYFVPRLLNASKCPWGQSCHWAQVYRLCWCTSISVWMLVFVCRVWISITRVCAAAKAGQESRARHWLGHP